MSKELCADQNLNSRIRHLMDTICNIFYYCYAGISKSKFLIKFLGFVTVFLFVQIALISRVEAQTFGGASDFNLFARNGVQLNNSDVEGRVAGGGNSLIKDNYSVGYALSSNASRNDVIIDGTLATGYGMNMENGSIVHSGAWSNIGNGVFFNATGATRTQATSPINFGTIQTELTTRMTNWAALTANGTASYNAGTLTLTGTNATLNVFNFASGFNYGTINNLQINVPVGSSVLINYGGTSPNFSTTTNMTFNTFYWDGSSYQQLPSSNGSRSVRQFSRRILWNFYQATTLTVQNIGFKGSILAPNANLRGGSGHIEGQVMVSTVSQDGTNPTDLQFNWFPFDGKIVCPNSPNISLISNSPVNAGSSINLTASTSATPTSNFIEMLNNGNFSQGWQEWSTDYPTSWAIKVNSNVQNDWTWGPYCTGRGGVGNLLFADGQGTASRVVYYTIPVENGRTYNLSFWAFDFNGGATAAKLRWTVNGTAIGSVLNLSPTGSCSNWQQNSTTWTATSTGTAVFAIVNTEISGGGNDFGLDDVTIGYTETSSPTWSWTGPNGYTSTQQNPVITNATLAMSGTYSVNLNLNCCSNAAIANIVVNNATPFACPAGSCTSNNLILNPQFETNTNDWTASNGQITRGGGGTFGSFIEVNVGDLAGTYTAFQDVAFGANAPYQFTGYAAKHGVNNLVKMYLEFYNGTTYLSKTADFNVTKNYDGTFQIVGFEGNTPANTTKIRIVGWCQNNALKFDNLSLVGCTTISAAVSANAPCVGGTLNLTSTVNMGNTAPNELVSNGNFNTASVTGFSTDVPAGSYGFTTNPNAANSGWVASGDKTSGTGNMMWLSDDNTATNRRQWYQTYTVAPNTVYTMSVWVKNVLSGTNNPTLYWSVNGTQVGSTITVTNANGWALLTTTWNSGSNTSATFAVVLQANFWAYDFVIDDVFVGSTGVTYSWTGPSSFTNTTQNPSRTGVTAAMAGVYTLTIASGGCTATATTNVTIGTTNAPIATGGNRCGTGTVGLSASGCSGIYNWYAAAVGGASLATGASFTTPSIAANTTYFVECTVGSCVSISRASALATVRTVSITNVVTSACINQPLQDVATVNVTVAWTNPPLNENIKVTIGNKIEYIDVAGGAISPQTITFVVPATGIPNNAISAAWLNYQSGACAAAGTYNAPTPCSSDNLACEKILYLCGPDKPADGDAYDHGFTQYLTTVGAGTGLAAYTKPDATGFGLYDPANINNILTVNLNDYTMVIVSPTTENALAVNLLTALKGYSGGLLMMNFAQADDLGLVVGNGYYNFQNTAYTNNTNQINIYNYDNTNPSFNLVLTGGDYHPVGVGSLWYGLNNASTTNNGINFRYNASDALPGVPATHGKRVYLGFHMNGLYSNAQNNGAMPAPVSSYFNPVIHLTLEAKALLDQSLKNTATGVNVTATGDNQCSGASLNLTSTGVGISSYAWTGPNGFTSNVQNPTRTNATAAMAGVYTLTVTSSTGCTATSTANVVVNTVTVTGAGSRCGTGTVVITAVGCGGTYNWYDVPMGGVSLGTTNTFTTPSLSATTNYYVSCTIGSCTSLRAMAVATVNPIPTATATSNAPIIVGGTLNLFSSGGSSYAWSGPNGFTSTQQNISIQYAVSTMAGVYTVTATANGCSATATTEVLMNNYDPGDIDCNLVSTLSFSSPVLVSGIDLADNATYRFSNVTAGTDAIVTIVSRTHSDIAIVDLDLPATSYGGYDAAMQPMIDYNWINDGGLFDAAGEKSITFRFDFVQAGTNTPKSVPNLLATGLDIDGSTDEVREFIQASGYQSYQTQTPSSLTLSGSLRAKGALPTYAGINELALDAMISYAYINSSSITVTYGADWNGSTAGFGDTAPGNSDEKRLNSLYFKCYNFNTTVCALPLAAPAATGAARCGSGSVTLASSGCTGKYYWYAANTGGLALGIGSNFVTPSLSATTTYYVECNAVGCTSPRTSVVAAINANPVPTATGDVECVGSTILLNATGGTVYAWTGPNSFTSATASPSIATATVAMAGIYTVTVTNAAGCAKTATANVVINTASAITATGSSVCVGGTLTATASGATTYNWSGPSGFTATGASISRVSATVTMNDLYVVTGINGTGCSSTAYASLAVKSIPAVPIVTNSGPICAGQPVTLTVAGLAPSGQSISLNGTNQYVNVVQDIPENNFTIETWVKTSALTGGIFGVMSGILGASGNDRHLYLNGGQLHVRVWQGVAWNTGVTINDNQWHHVSLVAQTGIGQRVYVDGVPVVTTNDYDHSDFNWQTDFSVGFSNDGGYLNGQIDNTRIWNVARTATQIMTDMRLNVPSNATGLVANYTFNGNTNASVGINGTTPNGVSYVSPNAYTYSWVGTNAPAASTNETVTTTGAAGALYSVTLTTNGCTSAAASTTVTVNAVPTVTATGDTECVGSTVNLSTTGTGTFAWVGPNGFASNVQNPVISSVMPSMAGIYTVTVTNNGCVATGTANVIVKHEPILSLSPVTACLNGNTQLNLSVSRVLQEFNTNSSFSNGNNGFSSDLVFNNSSACGVYNFTTNPQIIWGWTTAPNFGDRTTGTGNMMVVQGSATANHRVWYKTFAVTTNTNYDLSFFTREIWDNNVSLIWSVNGVQIGNALTPDAATWSQNITQWNSGANTSVTFAIENQTGSCTNNFFAIDDVSVKESPGNYTYTYAWTGPNGFTSTIPTPLIPLVSAASAGNYAVNVTVSNGCAAALSVAVTTKDCSTNTTNDPGEVCTNSTDDDGDGLIDCADPSCNCTNNTFACDNALYMVRISTDPNDTRLDRVTFKFFPTLAPNLVLQSLLAGYKLNALTYFGGYLYAMDNGGTTLYRIDKNFTVVNLGVVANLPTPNVQWSGGTSDAFGNYYIIEGTNSPNYRLYKIPLLPGGNYTATQIVGPGAGGAINIPNNAGDIAIDETGTLYAWIQAGATATLNSGLYTIDLINGNATKVGTQSWMGTSFGSLFPAAGGAMYAYGVVDDPTFGQVNFFVIDKATGNATQFGGDGIAVGRSDGCSCPWKISLDRTTNATCVKPNSTVCWNFTIKNQIGLSYTGAIFRDTLDIRFSYNFNVATTQTALRAIYGNALVITLGNFGGGTNNLLTITGMAIPTNTTTFSLCSVALGTAVFGASETIFEQAFLTNLPINVGSIEPSNYPVTPDNIPDPTPLVTAPTLIVTTSAAANSYCVGGTIQLNSLPSGAASYTWTGPSAFTSTIQNPSRSGATVAMGGVYSVTVLSSAGCSATATINVVIVVPTVTLNNQTSCSGQTVTLIPSGLTNVSSFSWNTGAVSSTITVNPNVTTNYTLTVTSTQGCTTNVTATITVFANPVAGITGTSTICEGISTTLTASGGSAYIWNTGAITPAITVNPTVTTSYTVNVYQSNTTATNVVTVLSNFDVNNFTLINSINSFGLPASLFNGVDDLNVETFHATRTNTGQDWGIKYNLNGSHLITTLSIDARNDCCNDRGKGGVMQVWRSGMMVYQSNILAGTGDGISSASPTPNVIGDEVRYVFLAGANTTSGEPTLNFTEWIIGGTKLCTTTSQVTVTVNARPAAPSVTGGSNCGTGNVTLSTTGCLGGTVSWFNNQTGGSSLANGVSYTANALAASTVYFASCTSASSCVSTTRNFGVATINPIPQVTMAGINTSCLGYQSTNSGKLLLSKFKATDLFSYNTGAAFNVGTASAYAAVPANGEILTGIADPTLSITYYVRIKNIENCTVDRNFTFVNQCAACPAGYCEPSSVVKTK